VKWSDGFFDVGVKIWVWLAGEAWYENPKISLIVFATFVNSIGGLRKL
jgi:hypothetical protein